MATFWAIFGNIWATFTSTSGHTGYDLICISFKGIERRRRHFFFSKLMDHCLQLVKAITRTNKQVCFKQAGQKKVLEKGQSVVVTLSTARSLLIPENQGSNPVVGKKN